ncbi:MAG: hypothetical protein ABIR18_01450 [Chitinophagaceae bacterium]
MTKNKKIFICFIIALLFVSFQFTLDRLEHLRLFHKGEVVSATSLYRKDWTGSYADFSFITENGQVIKHSEKCGSKETFEKQYANMWVIYNVDDPNDFSTLYDFNNYSLPTRIMFYFLIYLTFLTAFLFILERNVRGFYKFLKSTFRSA